MLNRDSHSVSHNITDPLDNEPTQDSKHQGIK